LGTKAEALESEKYRIKQQHSTSPTIADESVRLVPVTAIEIQKKNN